MPPEERNPILKDIRHLHEIVEEWSAFVSDLEELETGLSLLDEEPDSALQTELEGLGCRLESHVSSLELKNLLSGEQDDKNAIVTVHSGAGGTESADWAAMLLRMYSRWAENRGFRMEVLDYQAAEEAGVRSATFSVNGDYAFGYLKTEAGVHRLVRISPFDANKRRHTSFASVFVYPDIDETIEVEIDEGDLQI
ncbi:MAG: PCRF domain-containing protein, partial [SAR324 cluster bacterium]|nr:PCRF domain-containing protein [SAR324 cluster bacterium]